MNDIGTMRWTSTVPLAELRRRRKARVEVDGRAIALFLVGEQVYALDDTCVHKGRSLSRGVLWQDRIVCPGHQWAFDPRTGQPDGQDGCQPVHDARVVDGVVQVSPRVPAGDRNPS